MKRNQPVAVATALTIVLTAWWMAGLWGLASGIVAGYLVYLAPDGKAAAHVAAACWAILWFVPAIIYHGYISSVVFGFGVALAGSFSHYGEE